MPLSTRAFRVLFRFLTGSIGAWLAVAATAQGLAGQGLHLVQRVDEVLYGVDSISLAVLDNRHVLGNFVQVDLNQPRQSPNPASFVAECSQPPRLARSAALLTRAQVQLAELRFEAVQVLDGSRFLAEFACAASGQPGRAAQIARELFDRGGPSDMRSLFCDLQPDGSEQLRPQVELRFSEVENVVAVNRQWLRSGQVTPAEISFGAAARWRIDRRAMQARLLTATGEVLFVGACAPRPAAGGSKAVD